MTAGKLNTSTNEVSGTQAGPVFTAMTPAARLQVVFFLSFFSFPFFFIFFFIFTFYFFYFTSDLT